ncbi:MAG TPA: ribokinase [Gryllotalpicola sp.]
MNHDQSQLDELIVRLRTRGGPEASAAVLGSANLDIAVHLDRLPRPGETVSGKGVRLTPGGKGLNQAVALAQSGTRVEFLGAVGDDDFGRRLLAFLTERGIDTSSVRTSTTPTGTAHITVGDDGENSIIVVPGANHAVTALDEGWREQIRRSAVLVTQCELDIALVAESLDFARSCGTVTVLTPAPVAALGGELIDGIDILVGNELEIGELGAGDTVEDSGAKLSRRVPLVVATLGAHGAVWFADGAVVGRIPARKVTAVDTTAAGDTFVGAFASRLLSGWSIPEALRWAAAAASISVQRPGSAESTPSAAEVDAVCATLPD